MLCNSNVHTAIHMHSIVQIVLPIQPQSISNTEISKDPTTPGTCHYTTLWNIGPYLWTLTYFVTMATRVGRCKIWITPCNFKSKETTCLMQESNRYLLYKPICSRFCPNSPNFVAMATRECRGKSLLTPLNCLTLITPCLVHESESYLL